MKQYIEFAHTTLTGVSLPSVHKIQLHWQFISYPEAFFNVTVYLARNVHSLKGFNVT